MTLTLLMNLGFAAGDGGGGGGGGQVPLATRYRSGHRVHYVHHLWWLLVMIGGLI